MNALSPIASIGPSETLPILINRAVEALESARSSAEVLEARDMARVAYDAAKSIGRIVKAKQAHDSILSDVHRAQANAAYIRARAEMRLAEEYDAAQDRGEVATAGSNQHGEVVPTGNDLGLSRKDIFEARQLREAEAAEPGLIQRSLDAMIERGEEPTVAALKREVSAKRQPRRVMDPRALWLWGRIRDFERMEVLSESPGFLVNEMTDPMRADMRQMIPQVRSFLERMEREL